MQQGLKIFVSDAELRDALVNTPISASIAATPGPADLGFGESLYSILVDSGVVAIPGSVAASLLATWLIEAWKRRGKPKDLVAGIEAGDKNTSIALSDEDVDRVARRILELMRDAEMLEAGES